MSRIAYSSFIIWCTFDATFYSDEKSTETEKRKVWTLGKCVGKALPRKQNKRKTEQQQTHLMSGMLTGIFLFKADHSANQGERRKTKAVDSQGPAQTKGHAAATSQFLFLSRKSLSARVSQLLFFSLHSKWVSACEALNNPALQGMFCRNCMTRLPKGLPLDFLCPWVYFI